MAEVVQGNQRILERGARVVTAMPALVAAVLGVAVIYVAGFAGSHLIHNAAHDARHSLNFPCH